ncbi:unnamed protein product [Owenia fusiformis]|uniref:CCHC-type domain-containing protein n=1 Tax=Owenia fusiformis TaxID=6347 RepID=A0A8S4ND52_OWEFU|nr:unnamed protein product [Owenia fusiformis]
MESPITMLVNIIRMLVNGVTYNHVGKYYSYACCWFCKSPQHQKRDCLFYKAQKHFCSICNVAGHRNRDDKFHIHVIKDTSTNSTGTQTKIKTHNKHSQSMTVNMELYTTAVADFKRIQSEFFGQKNANNIYRERIESMKIEAVQMESKLKSQRKTIDRLKDDIESYADQESQRSNQLKTELRESQNLVSALTSKSNGYDSLIIDIQEKLKNQSEDLAIYKSVVTKQQEKLSQLLSPLTSTKQSNMSKSLGEHIFNKTYFYKPVPQPALTFDV